jgi:hypothetical protein
MKRKFSRYLPEQHSASAGHCPRLPKAIRCRLDDKTGKPVGINEGIGRHSIAGNSGGDLEMLQWTTISDGVRFGAIVHHTDAEREYAYDEKSHFSRLDAALDACRGK